MKHVVKYYVYFDILLAGPVYATTYYLFEENPKSPIIPETPSSRLKHRYEPLGPDVLPHTCVVQEQHVHVRNVRHVRNMQHMQNNVLVSNNTFLSLNTSDVLFLNKTMSCC